MNVNVSSFVTMGANKLALARMVLAISLISSIAGMLIADIDLVDKMAISILFSVLASSIYYGFHVLKNDKSNILIFIILSAYMWIAFPFKLMLAVNNPLTTWITEMFFSHITIRNEIASSFINVFPGILMLFMGFCFLHGKIRPVNKFNSMQINHVFIISVIILLMALRVFNQLVLNIGIPGVKPNMISFPLITGILELLSRPVLMAFVNLYLFYVLRLNNKKGIFIALLLVIFNIIIGLRVGYKSELVLQGLLLVYYYLLLFPYLSKFNSKLIMFFTAFMLVTTVVLYPLINDFRFYLLSGENISAAVLGAQARYEDGNDSFFISFLSRLNGIDVFYAATKFGQNVNFGLDSIFNNNVMELIKLELFADKSDDAITSFGTTQFSVFYLIGGGLMLSLCSFILGWIIRASANHLNKNIFKLDFTFQAYLPLLCIFWIKLISSGGNLTLYIKEFILVVISLIFMERFGTRNRELKGREA